MSDRSSLELSLIDLPRLNQLCGVCDENLKWLEKKFSIKFHFDKEKLIIEGEPRTKLLEVGDLLARACQQMGLSEEVSPRTFERMLDSSLPDPGQELTISLPRHKVRPRTRNQQRFLAGLSDNTIQFGIGPAGTGKTFLSVAAACRDLKAMKVERIVLSRPAVEAGERLGFLPGDLTQKIDPYLQPLFDALYLLLGGDRVEKMLSDKTIEVAPLAFLRGRSFSNCFMLLDEAQNATDAQMLMFLTRLGDNSRMVVTGDPSQYDLSVVGGNGLKHAVRILRDTRGIGITRFNEADIVRHPLVREIVQLYENDPQRGRENQA